MKRRNIKQLAKAHIRHLWVKKKGRVIFSQQNIAYFK